MPLADVRIRAVDPAAQDDVKIIAERMLSTLVEVLGEEAGGSLYTLEGTTQRVMWHLESEEVVAQVFVAETAQGEIAGHTIVRVDDDGEGREIGLFATTYVVPECRGAGVASSLLDAGEAWMLEQGQSLAATYTDRLNKKLQNLYLGRGYRMSAMPNDFVKMAKELT